MENRDYEISFIWIKAHGGYDWEDCEKLYSGIFLIEKDGKSVKMPMPPYLVEKDYSRGIGPYKPFEDLALFANFADMEGNADSFAAWADSYGRLTTGEKLSHGTLYVLSRNAILQANENPYNNRVTLSNGVSGGLQPSESFFFWNKEHSELRFAVILWELAVKKDMEGLDKCVQWVNDNTGILIHKKTPLEIGFEVLTDGKIIRPWLSNIIRYPDLIRPAMLYVQETINEKLRIYPLNVVIQTDERGELYKTLQPTSLLSAMWYQFSLVFTGEEQIRRCAICGKWENMKGRRNTWKKHAACANNERVKRFRKPDAKNEK